MKRITISREYPLSWGIWTVSPPGSVPPNTTVSVSSEPDGFMTGTEGTTTFKLDGTGATVTVHWNNPIVDSKGSMFESCARETSPAKIQPSNGRSRRRLRSVTAFQMTENAMGLKGMTATDPRCL
jgi:hypothetical protein